MFFLAGILVFVSLCFFLSLLQRRLIVVVVVVVVFIVVVVARLGLSGRGSSSFPPG